MKCTKHSRNYARENKKYKRISTEKQIYENKLKYYGN